MPIIKECFFVGEKNHALNRCVLLPVFRKLNMQDLQRCVQVCRHWASVAIDPTLWSKIDLSQVRLSRYHLGGVVRRQPEHLILDWANVSKDQLAWMIARLPQTRGISLQGLSWTTISALSTCYCPPLHSLNISYAALFTDDCLQQLLDPPQDSRPGLTNTDSRLRHLNCLKVAGCSISDYSMRIIAEKLPNLKVLNIAACKRITDAGIAQLALLNPIKTLKWLDLSNLPRITDITLKNLSHLKHLTYINLENTPKISYTCVERYFGGDEGVEVEGKHGL